MFGHHKGQTLQRVAVKDPPYHQRYIAMNESLRPEMVGTLSILSNVVITKLHVGSGSDDIAYHAEIYRPCWRRAGKDED